MSVWNPGVCAHLAASRPKTFNRVKCRLFTKGGVPPPGETAASTSDIDVKWAGSEELPGLKFSIFGDSMAPRRILENQNPSQGAIRLGAPSSSRFHLFEQRVICWINYPEFGRFICWKLSPGLDSKVFAPQPLPQQGCKTGIRGNYDSILHQSPLG